MTRHLLPLAALAALIAFGCDDDAVDEPANFVYPLAVGDTLVVDGTSHWSWYSPGIEHELLADSVYAFSLTLVCAEQGDFLGTPALRCEETLHWEGGEPLVHQVYYAQREAGLYLLGYEDGLGLLLGAAPDPRAPRFPAATPLASIAAGRGPTPAGKGAATEDLWIWTTPRQVFAYPLEPGRQWIYQLQGDPFRLEKRVVSSSEEEPGDGQGLRRFWTIDWYYDEGDDGQWDDRFDHEEVVDEFGLYRSDFRLEEIPVEDGDGNVVQVAEVRELTRRRGTQITN